MSLSVREGSADFRKLGVQPFKQTNLDPSIGRFQETEDRCGDTEKIGSRHLDKRYRVGDDFCYGNIAHQTSKTI